MPRTLFYIISLFLLAGVLFCLPLWLNERVYPVIPVIEGLVLYGKAQWVLLAIWAASFVSMVIPGTDSRKTIPVFLLLSLILALQDQIRWQPWLYQYQLMLILYFFYEAKFVSKSNLLDSYRILIAGIYFWSGIHKINTGFTEKILPGFIGFEVHEWGYLIAAFEALLGIALFIKPLRNYSLFGIWGMHLLIIYNLVFGNHNFDLVVLPWNIAMMIMSGMLFWNRDFSIFSFREGFVTKAVVFGLVLILPSLHFFGMWKAYMSFALFSGKETRAFLYVDEDLKSRFLPETIEKFDQENRIYLQSLSYSELRVPTPTEKEMFIEVFKSFCGMSDNDLDIIMEIEYLPNLLKDEWEKEIFFCDEVD